MNNAMGWACLIVPGVILLMVLLGKAPSAIHFPVEYVNHQGCMAILAMAVLFGILLFVYGGCTNNPQPAATQVKGQ